jgi:hypothetical protein
MTPTINALPALLGINALAAVNCRGLYVPCRSLPSVLARSVRPLIFENISEYQYSLRGSCTLVRSDDVYMAVFTEHQRQGAPAALIRIVSEGGNCLAAEMLLVVKQIDGEEYEDLRGLKIVAGRHRIEELSDFFPLPEKNPPVEHSRMLIAVGLPSRHSGIDYDPTNIRAGTISIPCLYEGPSAHVRGFHSVRMKTLPGYETYPVDGLSGGAMFSVDGTPGSYQANLRGIILRGGSSMLHYIEIAAVAYMAEHAKAQ